MTAEEKIVFEKEVREKIIRENRQKKAEWRKSHQDSIKASNEKYYRKLKEMKILAQASEILARRQKEEAELQVLANELASKVPEVRGGVNHD
ncbi:MAG: hypothetical protein ACK5JF_05980 [Oscillospiraceae bacterium]